MQKNTLDKSLEDTKKQMEELYSQRNTKENILKDLTGYDDEENYTYQEHFDTLRSYIEIAEDDLDDTVQLIEKKEDMLEKIELCKEIKKRYLHGYKRIIRVQSSKSVEDKLDRKKKAKKIAEIMSEKKIKTVGIFGEWGTGKTTFLEYLKEELPKEETKIIDIKATEYSDQEKIWAYFFTKMKESVKRDFILRIVYSFMRIKKNLKNLIIPLLNFILVVAMIVILYKYNLFNNFALLMGLKEEAVQLFNTGMNGIVIIFFIIKWILPTTSSIVDTIQGTQNSIASLVKREVNEKFGYKVIIKDYIEEIMKIWKNYRFVFCVDELDRCGNDAIMSFLEAVQLLEDYDRIQIVYTIDTEIVLNAIKKSGIHNPHNYLKKYVDLKVDLESINTQYDYVESIARNEYAFTDEEIDKIKLALENLEVNISIRDYIQILNAASELKERWINEQVIPEKCMIESVSEDVINWYNSLPIAIFYFAGSFWPQKIYRDFKEFKRAYIKVYYIAKNKEIVEQYADCPSFIKQTRLLDVLNVMRLLQEMPPIYSERIEEN